MDDGKDNGTDNDVDANSETDALRQRAEAAEAALAAAQAHVTQLRADRDVLIAVLIAAWPTHIVLDLLPAPYRMGVLAKAGLKPLPGNKGGKELMTYIRELLTRAVAP